MFRDQIYAGPGDLGEAFAAIAGVREDLPAHAGIPVTSQMIRDVLRGFAAILSREECGYLVRHGYEMMDIHGHQSRKRCGCAYTTWRSARAKPMSVTPVSTARSIANAVGADTATTREMPTVAAFCTIS
jgi:hypothetical protein